MDLWDKPSIRGRGFIVCLILGLILCCVGFCILYAGYKESMRYFSVQKTAITVSAEGYQIKEYNDDGDIEYDLYVRYSFNGKNYTNKYDKYESRDEADAMIGRIVEIRINPLDPSETVNAIREGIDLYVVSAFLFLIFGIMMLFVRIRRYYTEAYGMRAECLQKDLRRKLAEDCISWALYFFIGLYYGGLWIVLRELFPHMWIVAAIGFVIWMGMFLNWLSKLRKIRNGQYRTVRQTLVDKRIDDSGDSTDYELYYTDAVIQWKRTVSPKRYEAAEIGETVETVILEGKRRPFFVCDAQDIP